MDTEHPTSLEDSFVAWSEAKAAAAAAPLPLVVCFECSLPWALSDASLARVPAMWTCDDCERHRARREYHPPPYGEPFFIFARNRC